MEKIWKTKALCENKSLKPLEDLNLTEGEEVNIIVVPDFAHFRGILKEVKEDSVSLQHRIKDFWGAKNGSS